MLTTQTYAELGCPSKCTLSGAVGFDLVNNGFTYEYFMEEVKAYFAKQWGDKAVLMNLKIQIFPYGHPNNPERVWRTTGDLYIRKD